MKSVGINRFRLEALEPPCGFGRDREERNSNGRKNQPSPVQPASPKLTMSRDFIQVIGAAAALAAVIIAGMALVVSITVAPVREEMCLLREDMRSLHTEMQHGFEAVTSEFRAVRGEANGLRQDMNGEFKAIRSDMAGLGECLARMETRLERDTAALDIFG